MNSFPTAMEKALSAIKLCDFTRGYALSANGTIATILIQ